MEHWIAVYTKSRQEKMVYRELTEKKIQAYLPLVRKKRKWSDRMKWVELPLFNSYIFVRVQLKDSLHVLQTMGVHHIVKFGSSIATVPEAQVTAIRLMLEGGFIPESTDYYVLGDKVEIAEGAMKGVQGIVTRIDGEDRFIIKVDAIQHAISVHIDRKLLKPIKTHARKVS